MPVIAALLSLLFAVAVFLNPLMVQESFAVTAPDGDSPRLFTYQQLMSISPKKRMVYLKAVGTAIGQFESQVGRRMMELSEADHAELEQRNSDLFALTSIFPRAFAEDAVTRPDDGDNVQVYFGKLNKIYQWIIKDPRLPSEQLATVTKLQNRKARRISITWTLSNGQKETTVIEPGNFEHYKSFVETVLTSKEEEKTGNNKLTGNLVLPEGQHYSADGRKASAEKPLTDEELNSHPVTTFAPEAVRTYGPGLPLEQRRAFLAEFKPTQHSADQVAGGPSGAPSSAPTPVANEEKVDPQAGPNAQDGSPSAKPPPLKGAEVAEKAGKSCKVTRKDGKDYRANPNSDGEGPICLIGGMQSHYKSKTPKAGECSAVTKIDGTGPDVCAKFRAAADTNKKDKRPYTVCEPSFACKKGSDGKAEPLCVKASRDTFSVCLGQSELTPGPEGCAKDAPFHDRWTQIQERYNSGLCKAETKGAKFFCVECEALKLAFRKAAVAAGGSTLAPPSGSDPIKHEPSGDGGIQREPAEWDQKI